MGSPKTTQKWKNQLQNLQKMMFERETCMQSSSRGIFMVGISAKCTLKGKFVGWKGRKNDTTDIINFVVVSKFCFQFMTLC